MKHPILFSAFAILVSLLALSTETKAKPPVDNNADKPTDVRALLKEAVASGSLPKGMIVRIGACMGEVDDNTPADAKELVELWEFSSNQVCRVECRFREGKPIYDRIESRPFDCKGICKDLLDGHAAEIHRRKGTGPGTVLAGTIYHRGTRSIEVEWNGKTLLDLHETNGPTLDVYPETDARAFGKLYERLAAQARALLGPKARLTHGFIDVSARDLVSCAKGEVRICDDGRCGTS